MGVLVRYATQLGMPNLTTAPTAVQRWMVMGMREKLIELLAGFSIDTAEEVEFVADYLIANGFTIPVRCRDCKHRTLDFFCGYYCRLHKGLAMVTDDSFCSYGERRTENEIESYA